MLYGASVPFETVPGPTTIVTFGDSPFGDSVPMALAVTNKSRYLPVTTDQ